jgi:cytochrome c peroxidase
MYRHCLATVVLLASMFANAGIATREAHAPAFELASECPPGWELTNGGCDFRTLYQLYSSPEGFGGLRVPLPRGRDGFSPQQIDLGRLLFFDPILSADRTLSCAHCHHPDHAFSDGHGQSLGRGGHGWGPLREGGVVLPRGAPSLWNVGFLKHLFWDGRAESLEQQVQGPLFSQDEMGNTPPQLESVLSANATYVRLFAQAFHTPDLTHISTAMVEQTLAAFESCLISLNSRYDHYAHGDENALTDQEKRGLNLFRSFTMRCSQCHTPPLFTSGELAVIGSPEPEGSKLDPGAGAMTSDPTLRAAFKIPSLRNIALTAPYMHSGALPTLRSVVDFYNDKRGHAIPEGEHLLVHWHIALAGKTLDAGETDDLVAFLQTLTDESMKPPVPTAVPSGLPVVGRDQNSINRSIRP